MFQANVRGILISAALISMAVAATACGAEEAPTATTIAQKAPTQPAGAPTVQKPAQTATVAASPTSVPPTAPPVASKMGGTLKYGQAPNAEHMFFLTYSGGAAAAWAMTVANPLMAYGPDSEWIKEKSMAESFEVGPDGQTITFKLIKGTKFQDGTPYNAEAEKFSLDWALDPKNPVVARPQISAIDKVEVVDEYTIKVHTKVVFTPLITNLGMSAGMPFSPTAFQTNGVKYFEQHGGPSTGPFMVKEWIQGTRATFVRNPYYHVQGKPYLDAWTWEEIPNVRVRAAALQTGEIDIADIPPDEQDSVKSLRSAGMQEFRGLNGVRMSHFNAARPPFNDIRVRQAAQMAVDREAWNKALLGGDGHPYRGSVLPPNSAFAYEIPETSLPFYYKYDPVKARELLESYAKDKGLALPLDTLGAFTCTPEQTAKGCKDLQPQPITVTATANTSDTKRAELEAAWYNAVGFKVKVDLGAGNEAPRTFVTKEATFSLRGFGVRPHPSGSMDSYMGYGGYWNEGGWNTAPEQMELQKTLEQAAASYDHDEQIKFYQQAQKIYMDNLLGGVKLANDPAYWFGAKAVRWDRYPDSKWILYPSDASFKIFDIWLKK